MAWTAPTDRLTGDVITAAQWNTFLGATGDMSMTAAAKVTTNGDIVYATSANPLARLGIGSSAQVLTVSGGIPAWVTPTSSAFDAIQTSFRAGRKLLGEFSAQGTTAVDGTTSTYGSAIGTGMMLNLTATAFTMVIVGNEGYASLPGGANGHYVGLGSLNAGAPSQWRTVTAPNKSPRMLLRWIPGTSGANVASTMAGFQSITDGNQPTNTVNGAYLRANTTGNLFFVTRQGASETTTDLGVRPTVLTSYEIETTDAGVTWTCRNDTTATVVATHTTNVPTASTGCAYSVMGYQTGAGTPMLAVVNYMRVEGTFTP
jgi:hypothetical protein